MYDFFQKKRSSAIDLQSKISNFVITDKYRLEKGSVS